jgi:dinuclear metal center YbgI/SA1388 family protein
MPALDKIVQYLDRTLRVAAFKDASQNGLQVANAGMVKRICCLVDASMEGFEEAARLNADLVICHHGLSWGDSLKKITGLNYRRMSMLLDNDMALYACHLPLDAHPLYGNNAGLCKALGLQARKPFGVYDGQTIGFEGRLPRAMPREEFKHRLELATGGHLQCMDFGPAMIRTVGVVSGGAAEEIEEAAEKGLDVFVSGEPKLLAYHLAREHGINAMFAGHYATEVFGVRALASLLKRTFKLPATFVDFRTPF